MHWLTSSLLMVTGLGPMGPDTPAREPQLAVHGSVVAMVFGAGQTIYFTSSNDGGKTFGQPRRVMETADYTVDAQGGILLSHNNANYLRSKAIGGELKNRARVSGNAIERAKAGLANATAARAQLLAQQEG
jgi:hypothetical protein